MADSSRPSKRGVLAEQTNATRSAITQDHSKRGLDEEYGARKRARFTPDEDESEESSYEEEQVFTEDEDIDMIDVAVVRAKGRKRSVFGMMTAASMGGTTTFKHPQLSAHRILKSFVSSLKSDMYKCTSIATDFYLAPPYACAYSNTAKSGGAPLLAVATEQGSVQIMNTSTRRDWDPEPPRDILQPHNNGVFDVKWSSDDKFIATGSGDHTAAVSCLETERTVATLKGHIGTVKCIAWDPWHRDLLCTGGRDGEIRLWDLRLARCAEGGGEDDDDAVANSVLSIPEAHEDSIFSPKKRGRKPKATHVTRSVTNLVYPMDGSQGIISSGSFDGILRQWDFRMTNPTKRSPKPKAKPVMTSCSSEDPTVLANARPRGITSLSTGSGPTAGLIFGLTSDAQVHAYDAALQPLRAAYSHPKMQTQSFYVRTSVSPCGRWLASGSATYGAAFLFDVCRATQDGPKKTAGVALQGQTGEVGALDWADGALATCADDGTIRVWRPDAERHASCLDDPQEARWEWRWATEDV